jgi:DUF1365 family protein
MYFILRTMFYTSDNTFHKLHDYEVPGITTTQRTTLARLFMIAVCSLFLIVFIHKIRVVMKGTNRYVSPTDHAVDQTKMYQNPGEKT